MDEYLWSAFDNSSEDSTVTTLNSTVVQPTSSRFPARQPVSLQVVAIVGVVVVSIGIFANTVVLSVLVKARRQFGSSVHTLIVNQSAMDLWATVFGVFAYIVIFTHGFKYNGERILNGAVFVLFEGGALPSLGMSAEKMGLIVITLERYFCSSQILSRLDDQSGRGLAVDRCDVFDSDSRNVYSENREWAMPETDSLAT